MTLKVGIVLSGGGARGIAHLGMLKVLNENGIYPDIISGSSAGSIIGAFYAYGYSPDEILNIILKTKLFKIIRPAFNLKGLLTLEKAYTFFKSFLPTDSFESLKIPLFINATSLENGQPSYFSEGSLIRSVMASSAIPVIFSPVEINGKHYIDGGIVNNLPVEPLQGNCDKIIGLHCNPVDKEYDAQNMKQLLERTFLMTINENVGNRKKFCDLYLEPYELRKFGAFDFKRAAEMFDIGYKFARLNEKNILDLTGRMGKDNSTQN